MKAQVPAEDEKSPRPETLRRRADFVRAARGARVAHARLYGADGAAGAHGLACAGPFRPHRDAEGRGRGGSQPHSPQAARGAAARRRPWREARSRLRLRRAARVPLRAIRRTARADDRRTRQVERSRRGAPETQTGRQAYAAMSENIKNMILAAALSLVFIGLWDYFYAFPEIDKQRRAQTQQEQLAKVPQLGAPERVTAGQPPVKAAPKSRAEALALSPRIAIDTRSISGSIALKGGRIDDVSLKNYRETVDPSSPIITLLSPEDGAQPLLRGTRLSDRRNGKRAGSADHRDAVDRGCRRADDGKAGDADLGQWPRPRFQARHLGRRRISLHRQGQRREQGGRPRHAF